MNRIIRPHIKLLKPRRFKGMTQFITLPAGRCLEVKGGSKLTWVAEIEDGEGHFSFRKDDPNVVEATMEDLLSEPDYNDYESFSDD